MEGSSGRQPKDRRDPETQRRTPGGQGRSAAGERTTAAKESAGEDASGAKVRLHSELEGDRSEGTQGTSPPLYPESEGDNLGQGVRCCEIESRDGVEGGRDDTGGLGGDVELLKHSDSTVAAVTAEVTRGLGAPRQTALTD